MGDLHAGDGLGDALADRLLLDDGGGRRGRSRRLRAAGARDGGLGKTATGDRDGRDDRRAAVVAAEPVDAAEEQKTEHDSSGDGPERPATLLGLLGRRLASRGVGGRHRLCLDGLGRRNARGGRRGHHRVALRLVDDGLFGGAGVRMVRIGVLCGGHRKLLNETPLRWARDLAAVRSTERIRKIAEDVNAVCTEPASNQEILDLMWAQHYLL